MTYPCLVLDHDDTVVNSTATVHYPCFAEYTAKFFPKAKRYTLEEYVLKNFDPGVYDFFHGEVGMTEEELRNLFTLFYRGGQESMAEGHGIGMALARKIVQLHRGRIAVHSEAGQGTTFVVELPHV